MRDAGADGAARGATALHRAVSAIKRDVVPIRITAPGGEITPRSAAAMQAAPRGPSSFGTEQRRASEAAEARAWVMAQEQLALAARVGRHNADRRRRRQAAGLAAEQPARRRPRGRGEPLLAHNDDAPAPPPPLAREPAESADVERRNMTSLVSNSDRSSRRI